MLPAGYVGLVVCDTRRAREWQGALRRRGLDVVLVETRASEDKGAWQVAVAAADARAARAFVHDVTQGRVALSPPWWRQGGVVVTGVIVVGAVAWTMVHAC